MLKKIRLIDFKSFVDEEVELAPLTLLVGANASGKSNFLDAIRFLQGTAFGLTVAEVLDGEKRSGPDAWPGIRGGIAETARMGQHSFTINSRWLSPSFDLGLEPDTSELIPDQINLLHSVVCSSWPSQGFIAEHLGVEEAHEVWLKLRQEGKKTQIHHSQGPPFRVEENRSLLGLESRSLRLPLSDGELTCLVWWNLELNNLRFLDTKPSEMRGYGKRNYPLGVQGQNVSGVLRDLSDTADEKSALVDWLAELCAPEIVDLDFLEVKELGDVMAMFVEKGGKRISARSISDGTLHFLGTLLALRTAEPGSILLIEEIETGLHPTRIRLLVEYLEAVTRERQIQVIATTHSPVVLQWLNDESLRNTIVFGRVPDREGTIMRRIGDLPHFDEVIQRKGIDELFTTGWLEMAL
jgi:AAA domain, putative AbiEii toxin, Type IV TA system/AAA ATPase domain